MEIIRKISKFNFSKNNKVEYIVIHDTGNTTDSAKGNAEYFNTCNRDASAHYFIDDKVNYQVVEEYNAAWHTGAKAGSRIHNHNSIGVEMCRVNGDVTAITEANTIQFVKDLIRKYNITPDKVVRHYDVYGKNCPASFSKNDWARWKEFKRKLG